MWSCHLPPPHPPIITCSIHFKAFFFLWDQSQKVNIGLFISEWWTERIQLFDMHFMFLNCYKYPSILFLNCSNFPEVSEYENNLLSLGPSEKKICDSFWAFPAFQYHFFSVGFHESHCHVSLCGFVFYGMYTEFMYQR